MTKRPQLKQTKPYPWLKWKGIKKNVSFLICSKIEHTFCSLAIPVLGAQQEKCTHLCNKIHVKMLFETLHIIASLGYYANVHQDLKRQMNLCFIPTMKFYTAMRMREL